MLVLHEWNEKRRGVQMTTKIDPMYEDIHTNFGCAECEYADQASINKGPCCTFSFKLDFDDEGNCTTKCPREEKP